MPRFLRYLSHDFQDADGRPDQAMWTAARSAPETWHLPWMYAHYATPMRSDGIAKVNVLFTSADLNRVPSEVLGIASVHEPFDHEHFKSLPPKGRQQYFLDRFHGAMMRCATQFGWNAKPLQEAYQRVIADDFRFSFFWKKPLASPDRRLKVQAFVGASFPTHLYLVFFDRSMREQSRTLLSAGADGPGAVEFALGKIEWMDSTTVKVQQANGRDCWLASTDGGLEFHYPRAEGSDPQGAYDLGRMYYDGQWVLQDRSRGLTLIQAAAVKGLKHAIRFLATLNS